MALSRIAVGPFTVSKDVILHNCLTRTSRSLNVFSGHVIPANQLNSDGGQFCPHSDICARDLDLSQPKWYYAPPARLP